MYAIIATGGKQYKVAEGDIIKVEKLNAEEGSEVSFDVVAVNTDKDVLCGDACKSASVKATVLGEGKGKKVVVYKYKRKTGYHKNMQAMRTQAEILSVLRYQCSSSIQ